MTHRLTLLPWMEIAYGSPQDGYSGFPAVEQQRWTAACDCGWHSTFAGLHPNEVLRGYADHLDEDEKLVASDELDTVYEMLRRVVMDFGPQPCGDTCTCSAAQAKRMLREREGIET